MTQVREAFRDKVAQVAGPTTMTEEEWRAEGKKLFGDDPMKWRFRCPSCDNAVIVEQYKAAGAPDTAIAFSCVGRWMPETTAQIFDKRKGYCNYAGGGLFGLNPITVIEQDGTEHHVFAFDRPIE